MYEQSFELDNKCNLLRVTLDGIKLTNNVKDGKMLADLAEHSWIRSCDIKHILNKIE